MEDLDSNIIGIFDEVISSFVLVYNLTNGGIKKSISYESAQMTPINKQWYINKCINGRKEGMHAICIVYCLKTDDKTKNIVVTVNEAKFHNTNFDNLVRFQTYSKSKGAYYRIPGERTFNFYLKNETELLSLLIDLGDLL